MDQRVQSWRRCKSETWHISSNAARPTTLIPAIPFGGTFPSPPPVSLPMDLFFNGQLFHGHPRPGSSRLAQSGPYAVYSGNRYGANLGSGPPNLPSCGYDSAEIQKAYGLNRLYKKGWNGTGQTIVIVDAFGSEHDR